MSRSATASKSSLWGAILLVGGTCIGGGMLALPVETGVMGFWPSSILLFISWLFMMATGLLLIEANLWVKGDVHYMSIADKLLKTPGKIITLIVYTFMGYASLVGYTSAGGLLLSNALSYLFGITVERSIGCVFFVIIFGPLLYLGTRLIGKVNAILVGGMVISYFGLLFSGISEIKAELLSAMQFKGVLMAFPLLLTTYSYQMIVPSLTPYLNRDPIALRKAVIYGSTVPFVTYILWQLVTLGTIPVEGDGGLVEAFAKAQAVTEPLRAAVGGGWLSTFADFFAFFALVTSYLGIALGTFDFLADALKVKKNKKGRRLLEFLVIVPTLLFAIAFPRAFLVSLELTGGFGDAILSGILPISMVWVGRYHLNLKGDYRFWGGKSVLLFLLAISIIVFVIQILALTPR